MIAIALRPDLTDDTRTRLRERVSALVAAHPLYPGLT